MLNALKNVTLVVTGGIAAYKSCEFLRLLKKEGIDVHVVMTEHATRFIQPLTFEALSGNRVICSEFGGNDSAMPHIDLARHADCIIVMPATANIIGKMANGIADEVVSSLLMARRGPVVLVPSMNMYMWQNPATVRNVAQLRADGVHIVGPAQGYQACGDIGAGRMLEPREVIEALKTLFAPKALEGVSLCITAGPTFEAIDPVRGITNRSSGRQGYAIAEVAQQMGANVTLVSGPVNLPAPAGVKRISVTSAKEMNDAVQTLLAEEPLDAFIGVAAVADWRVEKVAENKIKKAPTSSASAPNPFEGLTWVENPDILKNVGTSDRRPRCVVGFAAETDPQAWESYALSKLEKKGADMIVLNNAKAALGSDHNAVTLFSKTGVPIVVENTTKAGIAKALLTAMLPYLR